MKNTSNKKNTIGRIPEIPAKISSDALAYATDDEITRHGSYLQSQREQAARYDVDLRPWEEEIAYVQREIKIRSDRRVAHERYTRSMPRIVVESENHDDYSDNVLH